MGGTGNMDLLPYNKVLCMASANFVFHEISRKPSLISVGTETVLSTLEIPNLTFFLMEMGGS